MQRNNLKEAFVSEDNAVFAGSKSLVNWMR
jgi:hypothetical protein